MPSGMTLFGVVLTLMAVVLLLGCFWRFTPETWVPRPFKSGVLVVAGIIVLLWILFGVFHVQRFDVPIK